MVVGVCVSQVLTMIYDIKIQNEVLLYKVKNDTQVLYGIKRVNPFTTVGDLSHHWPLYEGETSGIFFSYISVGTLDIPIPDTNRHSSISLPLHTQHFSFFFQTHFSHSILSVTPLSLSSVFPLCPFEYLSYGLMLM